MTSEDWKNDPKALLERAFAKSEEDNERRSQEYGKFFDAMGVKRECPCCGGVDWNVIGGGMHSIPALIYVEDTKVDPRNRPATGASLTIVAACKKCGFLRQHLESAFLAWSAGHGERGE